MKLIEATQKASQHLNLALCPQLMAMHHMLDSIQPQSSLLLPSKQFIKPECGTNRLIDVQASLAKIAKISPIDFRDKFWPAITSVLASIFPSPASQLDSLRQSKIKDLTAKWLQTTSQEELQRLVYNLCCQRFANDMHDGIVTFVRNRIRESQSTLIASSSSSFLWALCQIFSQFQRSVQILAGIFFHIDRTYTKQKFKQNLSEFLVSHFTVSFFCDARIFAMLRNSLSLPLTSILSFTDPSSLMCLAQGLYALDSGISQLNMPLFALYIPGLSRSKSLGEEAAHFRKDYERMVEMGYPVGNGALKRKHSEAF
eukprot:TRINITY_DN8248_c0_g1_i1.p1 TRINITY_DN8248_c0_g1~~TRINITY_DN8248_c0_g1_i1.p1  ORF type:complete len:313 (+),score=75.83 TRINITY_DN8248_c0_g1_i1:224-1162(+)